MQIKVAAESLQALGVGAVLVKLGAHGSLLLQGLWCGAGALRVPWAVTWNKHARALCLSCSSLVDTGVLPFLVNDFLPGPTIWSRVSRWSEQWRGPKQPSLREPNCKLGYSQPCALAKGLQ